MESRMTVVQALDERDLLIKKIRKRIENAQFVDLIGSRAGVTLGKRIPKAEFAAEAQRELMQIQDLITRYDLLNEVITVANATTWLETSRGRMPVSCAIALRNRLRGNGPYGELTDFEGRLAGRMKKRWKEVQGQMNRKNEVEGRGGAQKKKGTSAGRIIMLQNPENSMEGKAVKPFQKQDSSGSGRLQILDPLRIRDMAEEMEEQRETLLAELDTKIKISNAVTYVEI